MQRQWIDLIDFESCHHYTRDPIHYYMSPTSQQWSFVVGNWVSNESQRHKINTFHDRGTFYNLKPPTTHLKTHLIKILSVSKYQVVPRWIRAIKFEILRGGRNGWINKNMCGVVRKKIKIHVVCEKNQNKIYRSGRQNFPFRPLRISNGIGLQWFASQCQNIIGFPTLNGYHCINEERICFRFY